MANDQSNTRRSTEEKHEMLNVLNEIASLAIHAAEAETLENTLEHIAHASRKLVNARYAALSVPRDDGSLKYFKVSGITQKQFDQIERLPVGQGLLGVIQQERKPLRLDHMSDHPRSVGFCKGHPDMTSLLGVPIQVGQQFFGTLYLTDREDGQPFSEEDQWLIEIMAGYAALAIAGAQLGEQQKHLTLLEERQRIGMELHDGVIQSLYAIGMHLELVRNSGQIHPDDLLPFASDLNGIIEDIRTYIHNLKVRNYQQETIYDSLAGVVARLHVPDSLEVRIDAPEQHPPFMPATFDAICQIANEAISNAIRHANAHQITITAHQSADAFQIVITDDGQGFDPDILPEQDGLGLRNIQQRARIHNGEVLIETAPDQGTRLIINIPVRAS